MNNCLNIDVLVLNEYTYLTYKIIHITVITIPIYESPSILFYQNLHISKILHSFH